MTLWHLELPESPITVADIQSDPSCIAASISMPSGLQVTCRPLAANDAGILGQYFHNLSVETRRRYAPHAFDQATADHLCATINYAETIRMIATVEISLQQQVVAYLVLVLGAPDNDRERYAQAGISLDPQTDCTVAPSVADAYQDRGMGSSLMSHLMQVARELGRRRMVLMGGVQATNHRAVHYYQKHGFHVVHTFEAPAGAYNHDMVLDLNP